MEAVALELSDHAVERWHERVRPGLSPEAAEDDLVATLETHGHFAERPDWVAGREYPNTRWLMLGDDIAFPVQNEIVISCLTRATYRPHDRRNATNENGFARRARRASENPAKRKAEGREAKRNRKRDRSRWRDEA
jgi:hypothetical protein